MSIPLVNKADQYCRPRYYVSSSLSSFHSFRPTTASLLGWSVQNILSLTPFYATLVDRFFLKIWNVPWANTSAKSRTLLDMCVNIISAIRYRYTCHVIFSSVANQTYYMETYTEIGSNRANADKLSYADRLARLKLESLEVRRLRHDLILTYKILFGLTDMNQSDCFTFADRTHSTRGHAYKLLPSH